jgi:protein SCO1/2
MKSIARFCCILLLASLSACWPETFRGTDIRGVDWGGPFELTAHNGKRVASSEFGGKAVVLFFGYTHCPDVCAPTLAKLAHALTALGADAERVQVLFVTVDPRHDTPAQLAAFVPTFHPSFIGLTGSEAEIAAVARDHRIPFARQAGNGAQVDHSGTILVKDTYGKLRLLVRNEASVDDIVHDLRLLLKQG